MDTFLLCVITTSDVQYSVLCNIEAPRLIVRYDAMSMGAFRIDVQVVEQVHSFISDVGMILLDCRDVVPPDLGPH